MSRIAEVIRNGRSPKQTQQDLAEVFNKLIRQRLENEGHGVGVSAALVKPLPKQDTGPK